MAVDISNLALPSQIAPPNGGAGVPAPPPTADQPVDPSGTPAPPSPTPDTGVNPAVPPAPPAGGTPVGTPNVPPNAPHARLLKMIQGLSTALVGVDAFGKAIATHGKEGGIEEVQQYQAEQQRQKLQAQQAAQELKTGELQQQKLHLDIANAQILNTHSLATLPDAINQSHTTAAQSSLNLTKEKFDLFANTGMNQQQIDAMMAGSPIDGKTSGVLQANAQRQINFTDLPKDNANVAQLRKVLADPNAKPQDLIMASRQVSLDEAAAANLAEKQIKKGQVIETAPVGEDEATSQNARSTQRYQELHPKASLPAEFKVTGDMNPAQVKRVTDNLKDLETSTGLTESRALTNAMHQENLDAMRGPQGIDPSLQGKDYLDAVASKDPGQAQMIAGYGQGRLVLSPTIARTPQGQALTKQILRAYPNYQQAKAEGYQKQYNEFTSGKTGTAINSYKTSLDHLNDAFDNVNKASNVDLNNPTSDLHRALDTDKEVLSTELAKAVSNGNMTEGEKDGMLKAIDGKTLGVNTKDAYLTRMKETVKLLKGKLGSYQSQWNSTAVPGADVPSNLQDAAAATDKLAGSANPLQVTAPDGSVHTFKDQQGVDTFKKLAGIK